MTHTTFRLRRNMYVILKNNTHFIDKLIETHDRYYLFEKHGKVQRSKIRSMNYAGAIRLKEDVDK